MVLAKRAVLAGRPQEQGLWPAGFRKELPVQVAASVPQAAAGSAQLARAPVNRYSRKWFAAPVRLALIGWKADSPKRAKLRFAVRQVKKSKQASKRPGTQRQRSSGEHEAEKQRDNRFGD